MQRIENINEIQRYIVEILKEIKCFCEKNTLNYSLGAGTMLGAIRHQGFIPWDDDIDVFMLRADYDEFIKKTKKRGGKISDRYIVKYPDSEDYCYPFLKVIDSRTIVQEPTEIDMELGLWVDIFPIDYHDGTPEQIDKIIDEYAIAKRELWRFMFKDKRILKKCYRFVSKYLWRKDLHYWKKKLLQMHDCRKGQYAGTLIWGSTGKKDLYPADFFEGYTTVIFEGEQFQCFLRFDDILRHRYGNYMELPPVEERVSHNTVAFLKDEET